MSLRLRPASLPELLMALTSKGACVLSYVGNTIRAVQSLNPSLSSRVGSAACEVAGETQLIMNKVFPLPIFVLLLISCVVNSLQVVGYWQSYWQRLLMR